MNAPRVVTPRLHVPQRLAAGELLLPPAAARHVQVLRLQPGAALRLFDGHGGEWLAQLLQVGRRDVQVRVERHEPVERELPLAVTLAIGMPANERMDALVEKAAELGAAALQPLMCARSVLRLDAERALRRQAHWQQVAIAACEQCGRNRVPLIGLPQPIGAWLGGLPQPDPLQPRWLLSLGDARPWREMTAALRASSLTLLSGPEGGFDAAEELAARQRGFVALRLGERVLRADTAPLAALAALALTSS